MTRRTIEIVAFLGALLLAALALHAWLDSRDEQQRLQSTLTAQKKVVDAADARESARNATLADALAQIAALKRSVQTPEQIVGDLAKYLPLPQPITLSPPPEMTSAHTPSPRSPSEQGTRLPLTDGIEAKKLAPADPRSPTSPPSGAIANRMEDSLPDALSAATSSCNATAGCSAQIPTADLKPLDDYVQNCRACQAELAVAKQNSLDDAAKIAALTDERNAAVTAAKGGTFWRRLRRNAVWFGVGAAVGVAAGHAAKL